MQDLSNIYNAIHIFYTGQKNAEAETFLEQLRRSTEAWMICDRILGERKDSLACCFAAQCIRQKILNHLREVPHASLEPLRDSLISHLSHIQSTDQTTEATITQLCLAVADLYIQVPSWTNFIAQILNRFTALEGDRTRMVLTLLKAFPEELETLHVGENRRSIIREELAANGDSIVVYLSNVLQANIDAKTHDVDITRKVLQCLTAFLQNPAVRTEEFAKSQLLKFAFQIVSTPGVISNLHDAATDCIIAALVRMEDLLVHIVLATEMQQMIFRLRPVWDDAVVRDDSEQLHNLARIFVEFVESCMEPIVNQNADYAPLHELSTLHLLLEIAKHKDYSLVEMSFNVWYRISEGLFMFDDNEHVALFRPVVTTYMECLVHHSCYDESEDGFPDQTSDFADFRSKVSEAVKDVTFILGTDDCVKLMYHKMTDAIARKASWAEYEAPLFVVSNVIQNLLPEEDSVVPEILMQLCQLTTTTAKPALLVTAFEVMGASYEWLTNHTVILESVMLWLLSFINKPEFAPDVCRSVEKICSQYSDPKYVSPLMAAIQQLEATSSNGRNVERACVHITKAISTLCNSLPADELTARLREMCEPILMRLQMIIDMNSPPINDENKTDAWIQLAHRPIIWIDRLSAIFQELKPPNMEKSVIADTAGLPAWFPIAQKMWEICSRILTLHQDDNRIVEHTCRAIRYVVRALGPQSTPLIGPLADQLVLLYQHKQHSCVLYLTSIFVDEWGDNTHLQQGLVTMLESLAASSFPLLQAHNGFRNNPDTVDDLFRLATRYVLRMPSIFFKLNVSIQLFECAIHALHLDHQDAARSVTKFLCEILNQLITAVRTGFVDDSVISARQLIFAGANSLVDHALRAALFDVPSYLRGDLSEIIALIGKYDRTLLQQSIQFAVTKLPHEQVTEKQLQTFAENIVKENEFRNVVILVRELSRLYK